MDLVQFFVTFFRWVSRHYTQWQMPQARVFTPQHSANPPHLLSNSSSRPLGILWLQKSLCVLSSASVHFTRAVVTCGSSHPPHTIACGQLGDVTDLQASTVGWCHQWRMGHQVLPGEFGTTLVPLRHLSCSWAAAHFYSAAENVLQDLWCISCWHYVTQSACFRSARKGTPVI